MGTRDRLSAQHRHRRLGFKQSNLQHQVYVHVCAQLMTSRARTLPRLFTLLWLSSWLSLLCLLGCPCCVLIVLLSGLTLAGVRLSVLKGGSNKVLAAAQRGGLLFTHKVPLVHLIGRHDAAQLLAQVMAV